MNWHNVKLIFLREVRDQLRDRRTLFMIFVLPLLLYPLLGMSFFQVVQFMREHLPRDFANIPPWASSPVAYVVHVPKMSVQIGALLEAVPGHARPLSVEPSGAEVWQVSP